MSSPNTAVRPDWQAIPASLRSAITARVGKPVLQADSPPGGFTPGLAVRLQLDSGRVFVKALHASHPLAVSYRHEAAVASLATAAQAAIEWLRWRGLHA